MGAPGLWTAFLLWQADLAAQSPAVSQPAECDDFGATLGALSAVARSARCAIAAGSVLAACPMRRVRLYKAHLPSLEPLFAAAG